MAQVEVGAERSCQFGEARVTVADGLASFAGMGVVSAQGASGETGMKLLLVEDHLSMRTMIAAHLGERGFLVDGFGRGHEALEAARGARYAAAILDLGLPDMDGIDLLRRLRGGPGLMFPLPALILTARDGVQDRVRGLDAGADDYIVKPFALAELDARLRAVLRRPGSRLPATYRVGNLCFDPASREATVMATVGDVVRIDLARLEIGLLEALLRAAPHIVVKDALEERVYGQGERASANALEAVISRLRRKLTAAGATPTLESARGIGYRLAEPAG